MRGLEVVGGLGDCEELWGTVGALVWSPVCMGEVSVGVGVQWRCWRSWRWLGCVGGVG
jgi:hypothetical protein